MSRKLLFLAGMVACFKCHTDFESPEERRSFYGTKRVEAVIEKLRKILSQPPLELIASALLPYEHCDASIRDLFTAYDGFVGMLADQTKREQMDKLSSDEIAGNELASEARDISHRFRDAISELFLTPKTELGQLTIEYGVF